MRDDTMTEAPGTGVEAEGSWRFLEGVEGVSMDSLVAVARRAMSPELLRHVDPEDAVQEALLACHRRLREVDLPPGEARVRWIRRILRRIVADLARKMKVPGRQAARLSDEQEPPDPGSGPEWALELADLRSGLAAAIQGLRPSEAEPLILKFFGGMSATEIAGTRAERPNSIAQRLLRALVKLRCSEIARAWGG